MNQAHALRSILGLLVVLTGVLTSSAWQPAHTAYKSLAAPRRRRPQLRAEPGDEPPAYDLLADIERFKQEKAAADAAAGLPAAPPPRPRRRRRAAPPAASGHGLRPGAASAAPTAEDKLIADAARFRERGTVVEAAPENPVQGLINVLGTVLGFNFVVIVGLFLWFLSGVFSLYALDNDAIIIAVKAAFDPFILPLLSTHMGLTFHCRTARARGEGDPEDDGGFRL